MYDGTALYTVLTPYLVTSVRVVAESGPQPVESPWSTTQTADGAWISLDFDPSSTADQQQAAVNTVIGYSQSAPVLSAKGKQLRYALNALGVRSAWEQAVAASTMETQDYWFCSPGIDVPQTNAKIAKLCRAAGTTPPALFQLAITF